MKTVELLQAFSAGRVQYVLAGGLAVRLHGFLRSTFNIENAEKTLISESDSREMPVIPQELM